MEHAIRIEGYQYDVDRLRADLAAIERGGWSAHFAKEYYQGDWETLPLIGAFGKAVESARFEKTIPLRSCPYVEQTIDSLRCEKHWVRLMRLAPGAEICEHRDKKTGWSEGVIRMHIPIVTNERVSFRVGCESVRMSPGELWFVDVQQLHSARNLGDVERVHLVLDLVVNDFVRGLFQFRAAPADPGG